MAVVTGIVREVRRHDADAVTIRLEAGGIAYRPGQHVKVDPHQFEALAARLHEREAERGRKEGPAYFSISSDGTEELFLEITPRLSRRGREALVAGHLVREASAGMTIVLEGPGGIYGLPASPPEGVESFLHVCAGSGVAPNRGMIRHALARGWPQRHLLVLQERRPEDVLFGEEWAELGSRPGFRMRAVFSRSGGEYVSAGLLRDEASGFLSPGSTLAFVCGPNDPRDGRPGFCDHAESCLSSLGIPPERILRERG